ncbi:hypothetical protein TREES_T100005622 [Tupaia chinensis]|uniref:Uncharacterized protein n=1 Tax=Tupaia chinensis TaxID=246437 RepID=L9JEI5_TUPCH|nr:hypothetical protein TREES_T100005622 [Tupaia chinensis]
MSIMEPVLPRAISTLPFCQCHGARQQSSLKQPVESLPVSVYLHACSPVVRSSFQISATCLTCCSKAAHWGGLASLPGTDAHSFLALAHASRNRDGAKHGTVTVPSSSTAAVA